MQLQLTAHADAVTELAQSVQYLTNNLLDDRGNPELAGQVKRSVFSSVEETAEQSQSKRHSSEEKELPIAECPVADANGSIASPTRQIQLFESGMISSSGADAQSESTSQTTPTMPGKSNGAMPQAVATPVVPESRESQAEGMDSLDSHHQAYTLDDFRSFCKRRKQHVFSADEWQTEYGRLRHSRQAFIEHVLSTHNAKQLKALATHFGSFSAHRNNKSQNAEDVYLDCLKSFLLSGSLQYEPMRESIEEAIDRQVAALSDDDFVRQRQQQQQRHAEHQKALDNPETLLEFHTFVRERSEDALSDE